MHWDRCLVGLCGFSFKELLPHFYMIQVMPDILAFSLYESSFLLISGTWIIKAGICSVALLEYWHDLPSPVPLIVAVHPSFFLQMPYNLFLQWNFLFHSPNNVAAYLCVVLSLHYIPFCAWELTIHSHFSITMETGDKSLLIHSNKLQWLSAFLRYVNLYYCNENNKGKSHSVKLGIFSGSTTFVMEIRAGGSRLASFLSSDVLFLSFLNAILIFFLFHSFSMI